MSGTPKAPAIRVDKWLWAVRVFKSRSGANDACTTGRVQVGEEAAKPATKIKVGDTITIRRKDRTLILKVEKLLEKRVSAALAAEAYEDFSPPVIDTSDPLEAAAGRRERGSGRPTKRDRREIQKMKGRK